LLAFRRATFILSTPATVRRRIQIRITHREASDWQQRNKKVQPFIRLHFELFVERSLGFYRCDTWQFFSFEVFQHGATARGYITYFIGKSELVYGSY
jgi:hypothetical protein